ILHVLNSQEMSTVVIDGVAYTTSFDHADANRQMKTYDEMRNDDVIICSYPRSGTHWTITLVDLVMREGDTEAADKIPINLRSQWMHISRKVWAGEVSMPAEDIHPMREAEMLPSPRLLCSNLSYDVMPESVQQGICKVILVLRNPKAVFNSRYKFDALIPEKFRDGQTLDGHLDNQLTEAQDKMSYGTWFNHVSGWWQNRGNLKGNIHFIKFEGMIENMTKVVTELAQFLNKDLSHETINAVTEYLQYGNMKKNPKIGRAFEKLAIYKDADTDRKQTFQASHMRKGAIDDWKNNLTVAQSERIDEYLGPRLEKIGLKFKYE
ncbi:unnamed protein product, partial [Owenia fusiformis]